MEESPDEFENGAEGRSLRGAEGKNQRVKADKLNHTSQINRASALAHSKGIKVGDLIYFDSRIKYVTNNLSDILTVEKIDMKFILRSSKTQRAVTVSIDDM